MHIQNEKMIKITEQENSKLEIESYKQRNEGLVDPVTHLNEVCTLSSWMQEKKDIIYKFKIHMLL